MHRRIGHEKVVWMPHQAVGVLNVLMRGLTRRRSHNWGSGDFDKYITGEWAVQTIAAAHSALERQRLGQKLRTGSQASGISITHQVSSITHHSLPA
jgi:hypothetical protein